ncbi:MAG TPA: porin family protein [Chitinophagaceae bacterium]|nr:porin family protein [Chitinophagaceae bacterium]
MKRILCTLSAIVLITCAVAAQQTHFGLKGGVNFSSVEIDDGEDYEGKTGVHLGGLAHIHITRHFALQPELVFSMQGGEDESENMKLKLNYINIPVLAQYMTNEGFRLQTGPQLGILTSAESKFGDVEIDSDDQVSTVDFSWAFGAGYLFRSGFGIDARYNLGISNISDDESFEARNRVFQLGVFYQFMHKK